jgi:hypothetical protein
VTNISMTNQSPHSTVVAGGPLGAFATRVTVEFDGGAGSGAVGTVALFPVTGAVQVNVAGVCSEDLVGAGATVEVGTAANPAAIIAQTGAPNIDNGEVWLDNTPSVIELVAAWGGVLIGDGADIILTVRATPVTDGAIEFVCYWTPVSALGQVA